jgi:hypothetical protein
LAQTRTEPPRSPRWNFGPKNQFEFHVQYDPVRGQDPNGSLVSGEIDTSYGILIVKDKMAWNFTTYISDNFEKDWQVIGR